jgi:hypothetical protein
MAADLHRPWSRLGDHRRDLSTSASLGRTPSSPASLGYAPAVVKPLAKSPKTLSHDSGVVDRVADMLDSMRNDMREEIRRATGANVGAARGDIRGDIRGDKDACRFVDLRETEGSLRAWVQLQLQDTQENLQVDLCQAREGLQALHARLARLEGGAFGDGVNAEELRRHVDARLGAHMVTVDSSLGNLAADLRQHMEARAARAEWAAERAAERAAEARLVSHERSTRQLIAGELRRSVDAQLQEHNFAHRQKAEQLSETKSDVLNSTSIEEFRQATEARVEKRLSQAYDMTSRLMKELRQDTEAQIAQTQEYLQRVVDEIQRGWHAQDEHLRTSMEELVDEALQQIVPKVSTAAAAAARGQSSEDAGDDAAGREDGLKTRVAELETSLDGLRRLLLAMRSEVFGMTAHDEDQDDDGCSDDAPNNSGDDDRRENGDEVGESADVLSVSASKQKQAGSSPRSHDSEEV